MGGNMEPLRPHVCYYEFDCLTISKTKFSCVWSRLNFCWSQCVIACLCLWCDSFTKEYLHICHAVGNCHMQMSTKWQNVLPPQPTKGTAEIGMELVALRSSTRFKASPLVEPVCLCLLCDSFTWNFLELVACKRKIRTWMEGKGRKV